MTSRLLNGLAVLMTAAATAGVLGAQGVAPADPIAIRDAWVRASTARRTTSSGYCRIENTSDKPVALVRIAAAGVGNAQIHTMADHDGQMSMRPLATLTIPPHATVDLAPGSTHIMLTELARPLAIGGTLDLQFTFEDGRTRPVRAVVRPLDAVSIR